MIRKFYIEAVASGDKLTRDYKELIPEPTIRRRMSRILKCGVSAGMECLANYGESVDAIITASGFGCLQDSEKFLRNVIENGETQLNPTPFIQSTFNTIGAQIALLCGNNSYNMTYSHGGNGFLHALTDAAMLLDEGRAKSVLVGVADEITPTLGILMQRLGIELDLEEGEYGVFFVLSRERTDKSIAVVELRNGVPDGGSRFFPSWYALRLSDAVSEVAAGRKSHAEVTLGEGDIFNTAEVKC